MRIPLPRGRYLIVHLARVALLAGAIGLLGWTLAPTPSVSESIVSQVIEPVQQIVAVPRLNTASTFGLTHVSEFDAHHAVPS